MRSDRKQTILFIIILLILSMGIGYAFLTTTLSIDGTSDIDSASWNVYFADLNVINGPEYISGDQIITAPTIGADNTSVSYHIKLNEPGDLFRFDLGVVNDGTLDAVIDDIILKVNGVEVNVLPSYLTYSIIDVIYGYNDVSVGDGLAANSYRIFGFEILYRDDVLESELPDEDQSLSISIQIVYKQSHYRYVYSALNTEIYNSSIGCSLPSSLTTYDNYQAAMSDFGYQTFIRYKVIGNSVYEAAVGFIKNGQAYYLVGNDGGSAFDSNKAILTSLFNSDDCYTGSDHDSESYSCCDESINYCYRIARNGHVTASDNNTYGCELKRPFSSISYICDSLMH